MFNQYPHTDYHTLNLDWLLKKVKDLETKINQAPAPIWEWYTDIEDVRNSAAPEGATIVYDGELYTIQTENNGYGIQTLNGWAIPVHITDHLHYAAMDYLEYDLGTLAGDTSARWNLEGSCYNSTMGVIAMILVTAGGAYKMVTIREDGTVVNRVNIDAGHGNDMCWIPSKNQYYIVPLRAGTGNIIAVSPDGITQAVYQVLDNGWPSAIGYDPISDRVICYSGTHQVNGSYTPTLLIMDSDCNVIREMHLGSDVYRAIIPNSAAYTASQGACCVGHNFVIASSVFFDDNYATNGFRLTQINTETGKVESYYNGLYPKKIGATEAEALVNIGGELKVLGYYNNDASTSTLAWREVSTIGQGSWR